MAEQSEAKSELRAKKQYFRYFDAKLRFALTLWRNDSGQENDHFTV